MMLCSISIFLATWIGVRNLGTEANPDPKIRGEQHAAVLEANLTSLESKLDALLASIEGGAALLDQGQDGNPASDKDGKTGSK